MSTLYSPAKLALIGAATYMLVWVVAPVIFVIPVSSVGLLFICASYGSFILGCLLYRLLPRKQVALGADSRSNKSGDLQYIPKAQRVYSFVTAVACLGMFLRVVDRYVVRGGQIGGDLVSNREAIAEVSGGMLGLVSGALYPFCFIPLFFVLSPSLRSQFSKKKYFFSLFLFGFAALDSILILSRAQLLVTLILGYLLWRHSSWAGKLASGRAWVLILFAFMLLVLSSGLVFSARLSSSSSLDFFSSLHLSAYSFAVQPASWVSEYLEGSISATLGFFVSTITHMTQYFLHGIYEFFYIFNVDSAGGVTKGALHFYPYLKVLSVVGVGPDPGGVIVEAFPRVGVFTSFFGPLWMDFGWFGLLVMLLLGVVMSGLAVKAADNDVAYVPLYLYLALVLLTMPIVNFVVSSQGMYIINASVIFIAICRFRVTSK